MTRADLAELDVRARSVIRGTPREIASYLRSIPPDADVALLVPEDAPDDRTLDLFARWRDEDARMTPDEKAHETNMWSEFERDINAVRDAESMRRL